MENIQNRSANPYIHGVDWNLILVRERRLHPGMTEADAAKLFYQALRGGDHLMGDPNRFRIQLAEEWNRLPDRGPEAPLIQVISPRGDMARLHLLPAKRNGMALESVVELLLAGGLAGTPEKDVRDAFPAFMEAACRMGFKRNILTDSLSSGHYHHSPGYGFASYRVFNLVGSGPRP